MNVDVDSVAIGKKDLYRIFKDMETYEPEEDVAYIRGCAELIIDDPEEDEKIIDICEDLFIECDSTQQRVIIDYYHDTIQKQLGTGVVVLPDGCRLAER